MSIERTTRIEVNGVEYGSVEEMAPDVRRLYEEAMRQLRERGPGGPDATPGSPEQPGVKVHATVRTKRRLIVNGEEVANLDELPEGVRDLVRSALAAAGEADTVVVGDRPPLEVRAAPPADPRPTLVTRDQRPAASGGPSVASRPGRGRRSPAGRFQRSARSGAKVSLVTSPAQARSHSASRTSRSDPPPAAANSSR